MRIIKKITALSELKNTSPPYILRANAGAGSGKTNLLASWFIKLFFTPGVLLQNILAITFTNAATAEMKERILDLLKKLAFSKNEPADELKSLFDLLDEKHKKKPFVIKKIDELIQNYSDFNIKTIDSFINSLISVSSLKLGISPVSEVFTNVDYFLDYALQDFLYMYEKPGGKKITDAVDRYLELTFGMDASTAWFVEKKFKELVKKLRGEEMESPFSLVENTSIKLEENKAKFDALKKQMEDLIKSKGQESDFLKNFMKFLTREKLLSGLFENRQWALIDAGEWLKKDKSFDFSGLDMKLRKAYLELLDAFIAKESSCYPQIYRGITERLEEHARKRSLLFIDELNKKIHSLYKEDEVSIPWCFFLIGDRINHFLIDEFQDTSRIQFHNLKPLIENVLSGSESGGGSFFLVGDVKQAIYRFKGGDAGLFTNIFEDSFPQVEEKIDYVLKYNFRSNRVIVDFASFYFSPDSLNKWVSSIEAGIDEFALLNFIKEKLGETYRYVKQEVPPKSGRQDGYLLLEAKVDEEIDEDEWMRKKLEDLFKEFAGRFPDGNKDIGVLVRKGEEEERITSYLLGIPGGLPFPIISEKSMDVRENPLLAEVISFLKFLNSPLDNLSFFTAISGRLFVKLTGKSKKEFFKWQKCVPRDLPLYIKFREDFSKEWEKYISPFFKRVGYLPTYDIVREIFSIWNCFENFPQSDGFFHYFLEILSKLEEEGENNLDSLLRYIESENDEEFRLKLVSSEKGIRVMTLHKAKGLSFDIVVLPGLFIALKNSKTTEFYIPDEACETREMVRLSAGQTKKISEVSLSGKIKKALDAYYKEQTENFIDELNLIYVGFTRAREEIYGYFSEKKKNILPFLFIPPGEKKLEIGKKIKDLSDSTRDIFTAGSGGVERATGKHWYEKLARTKISREIFKNAIGVKKGELVHGALSLIGKLPKHNYSGIIEDAVNKTLLQEGAFFNKGELFDVISKAVENSPGFFFLGDEWEVLPELEFITKEGERFVADRVLKSNEEIIVVDFKSGEKDREHHEQVRNYLEHLKCIFGLKKGSGYIYYLKDFQVVLC